MKIKPQPLQAIADHLGGKIEGGSLDAAALEITGVASLGEAGPGDLSFMAQPKYAEQLAQTRASAVLMAPGESAGAPMAVPEGLALVRVEHPYLAFARAVAFLVDLERPAAGVDPAATVASTAQVAASATIMAGAHVGENAVIGERTVLYPNAVVLERTRVGADCLLYPSAVVREDCTLGDRVILHANSTVGSDGFGFAQDGKRHVKIPQVGTVIIGDDVELGSSSCVDRAALGTTVVGNGTKIDDHVMVGHGSQIGENVILVAQVGIAGSVTLGENTMVGGGAGVIDHRTIGAGSILYSRSQVTKSFPPGSIISGQPARHHKENLRQDALLARIEKLINRVTELEKQIKELKGEE